MTYIPGGGSGKVATRQDVALNNPTPKDTLSYDATLQKWKNITLGNVVVTSATSTRPNTAGACLFTGIDPGLAAVAGDMWLSAEALAPASSTLYDQQFTGANGEAWDGFEILNTLGKSGGIADQQNGDGRLKLNSTGGYDNRVTIAKAMTPILDGSFTGAFRVPVSFPDIAVTVYVRGSGSQPIYQSQPATSYYLTIDPVANRIKFERQLNEQAATLMGQDTAYAMPANTIVHWRLSAVGSTVKVRIWKDADAEPSTWKWEFTDPEPLAKGIDGVGLRGEPNYDSGDVYFTHLMRTTTDTAPGSSIYVKKRTATGTWESYRVMVRSNDNTWK